MLALTLPLGLSRDDDAPPTVSSSAVRVLGVYCTFSCLREVSLPSIARSPFSFSLTPPPGPQDEAFLQDSGAAILHALASTSQLVRVQASWALGNLTDALFSSLPADAGHSLYSQLLSAASNALKDKDVVCELMLK